MYSDSDVSISYSFPMLRYAAVYNTIDTLVLKDARNVGKEIERCFKESSFADSFIQKSSAEGLKITSQEILSDSQEEIWEGQVVLSPRLKFKFETNHGIIELVSRASVVICIGPNNSKVWVTLFLRVFDSNIAESLDKNQVNLFFKNYLEQARSIAEEAKEIYQKVLHKHGFENHLKKVHEIVIKAVGSRSSSVEDICDRIRYGDIFSVSEEIKYDTFKKTIKDYLDLVFGEEFNIDEYENIIAQKAKELSERSKPSERIGISPFSENGMSNEKCKPIEWFGLKWPHREGSVETALFCKVESIDPPVTTFIGVGSDKEDVIEKARVEDFPNVSSRNISRAVLRTISPFIRVPNPSD